MGLFSSKKKIMVSSVVYNLAGDVKERVQYLPTVVVGKVLTDSASSMGDAIKSAMLGGPGIKMRSFGRWARSSGYSAAIGLQAGQLIVGDSVDVNALASQIPHAVDQEVSIQTAEIGEADYGFWADQWLLVNHPERANEDYELDFSELINTVYIRFPDTTVYSFNPVDFNAAGQYLYVSYRLTDAPSEGPLLVGGVSPVPSFDDYPSTSGWSNNGTISTPGSMSLEETEHTVVSYSDGRPNEESTVITPSTGSYTSLDTEYERKTYQGQAPGAADQLQALIEFQHNLSTGTKVVTVTEAVTTEDLGGGVTKTTTTTTTTESVGTAYSYRVDTQEVTEKAWTSMQLLIYQRYMGNPVLDAMFVPDADSGAFFPFLPIRRNNTFLSETYLPDLYARNVKAYKKAVGSSYDKLVDSIKVNGSLGDIDYAYLVYGVSLNTAENASKKYVYRFFQNLMQQGAGGSSGYDAWKISWNIANNAALAWGSWKDAQSNSGDPLFGTLEPAKIAYPPMPVKRLNLQSSSLNFNMSIGWSTMQETTGSGLGKPGAKVGELWWTQGFTEEFVERLFIAKVDDGSMRVIRVEFVSLHWQDSATTHRTVSMWGLTHNNTIYKGKGVNISAKSALADVDESGFIVPLHEGILRTMSLRDSTQMSTACSYVVFNCYQVVKQKWYSSSWFKIVIVVIAIVIAVVSMGTGTPVSAGLLGTAASVGAALGFAGTVAIIVGSIANAIAAMLLTKIITTGATALFGDKVGAVVGAIASVVAVAYGSGQFDAGSMSSNFSSLATAQNLMNLTMAAGSGYAGYIQAGTQDVLQQTEDLLNNYQSESRQIAAAYSDNLGYGATLIDPTQLTEALGFIPETANSFLSRTLLVGGDIADLTNNMLTNFATMTLTTELPA